MGVNKKILNATPVDYKGYRFKSDAERRVFIALTNAGFKPKYEAEKILLWEGKRLNKPWYLEGEPQITKTGKPKKPIDWTYTPDFVVEIGKYKVYIEVKGKENDVYPYKRKLCLGVLDNFPNCYFMEVHTVSGTKKTIEFLNKLKNEEF